MRVFIIIILLLVVVGGAIMFFMMQKDKKKNGYDEDGRRIKKFDVAEDVRDILEDEDIPELKVVQQEEKECPQNVALEVPPEEKEWVCIEGEWILLDIDRIRFG